MNLKCLLLFTAMLLRSIPLSAQIMYQPKNDKGFSFDSYGRVGIDWSFENGGSIGRRLNLNNMGSIGGRLEEQDYLELVPAFHFKPAKEDDPTQIKVQTRLAVYSRSLALFGNSSTSSLGGLTFAVPEIYAEARNINGKDLNIWIGARLYRTEEVHIADHFYFDDHSGQGFGIEYKNTRFSSIYVSSTDTTANTPPYFYLNIGNGVANLALRQRVVFILEHDFKLNEKSMVSGLFEYQKMGDTELNPKPELFNDPEVILNYPADFGMVFGLKMINQIGKKDAGEYHKLAIRYGTRLANGGDGGQSKTWVTYGAPDLKRLDFKGAYSLSLVDEVKFNLSEDNNLNAYLIFTKSKGAADSDHKALTYLGREIYNRKQDLTLGFRDVNYISDKIHFISEFHYSERKEGEEDKYACQKISFCPTFVPTGEKDTGARPQFRFVCSLSHYNDAAKEALYSPYLELEGHKQWGYYFGVKVEWWL